MEAMDFRSDFWQWVFQQDFNIYLDFLGTFAFAISGIRLASGKNIDLFGAFVIGMLTAVGGGTLRDVMLGVTPFWLTTPSYVIITLLSLLLVIVFRKFLVKLNETVFLFDAIGLGFFTIAGLEKTIALGFPFWGAIIMGVITGSFGGLLRDICINEIPLIFRKDIYAIASLIGGVIYGLLLLTGMNSVIVGSISVVAVIASRLIAVKLHISLPTLKAEL